MNPLSLHVLVENIIQVPYVTYYKRGVVKMLIHLRYDCQDHTLIAIYNARTE